MISVFVLVQSKIRMLKCWTIFGLHVPPLGLHPRKRSCPFLRYFSVANKLYENRISRTQGCVVSLQQKEAGYVDNAAKRA